MQYQSKKKYDKKYAAENLKRVPLTMQKTDYETLKNTCDKIGEPVNTFIKISIKERLEKINSVNP